MLQQLLITLPTEASTWVKLHHPKKAKEGAPLWEDVTKMFGGGGESRLMDGGLEEEEGFSICLGKIGTHVTEVVFGRENWERVGPWGLCSGFGEGESCAGKC